MAREASHDHLIAMAGVHGDDMDQPNTRWTGVNGGRTTEGIVRKGAIGAKGSPRRGPPQ